MFNPQHGSLTASRSISMAAATSPGYDFTFLSSSKSTTEKWSSIIGIVTAIVGNILISFALNTQRYAHLRIERESQEKQTENGHTQSTGNGFRKSNGHQTDTTKASSGLSMDGHENEDDQNEDTPLLSSHHSAHSDDSDATERGERISDTSGKKKSYLRSPYWWIGIVLMAIGEAGNFLAYGFAPASIVSPLGVVALISNCLVAPIMLKEEFRKRDLLGVVIAVGGAVTVVLSAKGSNPKLGPDEVLDLVKRWEFLTYLGITVFLILVLMLLSNKYGSKTIVIDIGLVGLFGGYTALSTKGIASLISNELWRVLTFPITYVLILVLVVTAVMQIKYVNRALQHFDSTQVIPTQFVTFTIFVVAGSAILYRDFESETADKVVQFFGGVVLTFLGVWTITSGRSKDDKPTAEFDEEDHIDLIDNEVNENNTHKLASHDSPPSTPKASSYPNSSRAPRTPTNVPNNSDNDTPALFFSASSRLKGASEPPSTPIMPRSNSGQARLSVSGSSTDATPAGASHRTSSPHSTPSQTYNSNPLTRTTSNTQRSTHRQSVIESMFPGPFTSPLSSGLSVVVADTLRRGQSYEVNSRGRAGSMRRPSLLSSAVTDAEPRLREEGAGIPGGTMSSTSSETTHVRPSLDRAPHSVEVAVDESPKRRSASTSAQQPHVQVVLNKDSSSGHPAAASSSTSMGNRSLSLGGG